MDTKRAKNNPRDRFLKLSLRKNRVKGDEKAKKLNRSSDVIILDDTLERSQSEFPKKVHMQPKIYSPIVINDSCELSSDDLRQKTTDKKRSRLDNISLNCSTANFSVTEALQKESRPSLGGWSPAQNITCATPREKIMPTTPQDLANVSLEQCSLKTIERSHKKVLDDLYGDAWKSVSTKKLFKALSKQYDNFGSVSKQLRFNDDDESDKENIRNILHTNKKLYLTGSDAKHKTSEFDNTEKKSKKKLLYTEKIPSTPDVPKPKLVRTRNATSTVKKKKAMSVTELVDLMRNDLDLVSKNDNNFDSLTKNPEKNDHGSKNNFDLMTNDVGLRNNDDNGASLVAKKPKGIDWLTKKVSKTNEISTRTPESAVKRLSFIGSLADNVPSWRCHVEALQYHDSYKALRDQLARRLYAEFNGRVFGDQLQRDMVIAWDGKLRSTAGTTTNRLIKNSRGESIKTSSIKLSTKVVDAPQRLRDTLIHELCHAATWLIDGELRAGHGPLWKRWASRALRVYPELGEISRCHDLQIHFKYTFKCNKCGYSIQRHSKSIDVTKKCCGYCRGTFEIIVNRKKRDGIIVSTPARKGGVNDFAQFVKENYASFKEGGKTHAQVMKVLGEQFSAKKNMVP